MKIGIVCYASLGGSGIVATEIATAMAERGHDVHLIASDRPWRFSDHSTLHFHPVPQHFAPHDGYTLALAAKITELAPALDVLHVHYAVPHAAAAMLGLLPLGNKRPVLVNTLHGTDVNAALSAPLTLALDFSDAVTAPSHFLKHAAERAFQLRKPVDVIANFVDTARYQPGLGDTGPVLLHVSNFRAIKRVADVITVFAAVRKRRPCSLVLVGDGDELGKAKELAAPFGDDVRFLGARHDIPDLLQSARILLLTSASESFGLAALEAQSAGVPVVGTRVGGVSEVVVDGETGFLAELGDIAQMAAQVESLLDDPVLYRRMSLQARANALSRFDRHKQVEIYEAYFNSFLLSSR